MKKNIRVFENGKYIDKEINYIPIRYIISILLAIFEIASIIAILVLLAMYVPYFYVAIYITVIVIEIKIIASDENPDYKVPWLIAVIALPIVGMMLYFMFSKRKLPKKIIKRLDVVNKPLDYENHQNNLNKLKEKDELLYTQALNLCNISDSHIYINNETKYFKLGEEMFGDMLKELSTATKFIFLEFFIIEEGIFWNKILEILKRKASDGVIVKLVYDDIGCMSTLPGNYYKELRKFNISAIPFSKLKGTADGEFNNRSHRKILVIDGKIAFTGGVNIADEYINEVERFGHWKDTAVKIKGTSVNELTRLFLIDYYLNEKKLKIDFDIYYNKEEAIFDDNFIIPFGDGPKPIYDKNVGKIAIMNLLNHATRYVYITTPYLIIDNELMRCIENASLRGVDVRIIIPHIPDKKMVFELTRSSAEILTKSNVLVYEYTPGFVHAKSYIADDKVGIIGTINLDYRSLTHHFENGVWFHDEKLIKDIKNDFNEMFNCSILINNEKRKVNIFKRVLRALLKLISPLL
ncbi:MAG: cardiolipin synthase [Bacilli bacterium]|nr:cardiolipin synthase [Bacilli bacterium]